MKEACNLPQADFRRQFGVELWVYPSLPAAIIGLSLLLGEHLFPRTRRGNQLLLLLIVTLLILVELAVALILWRFDKADGTGTWGASIAFYCFMTIPLLLLSPPFQIFHLFSCAAGWGARVGGVAIAALDHHAGGQPYVPSMARRLELYISRLV